MRGQMLLVVLMMVGICSRADALVLCAPKKGTGPVTVQTACEKNEVQLDPVTLGLQGIPGPMGVQGPKGDKGDPGPQGPPGSGLAGQIISAGVDVPQSNSVKVFTTPATGTFILTQFCTSVATVGTFGNTLQTFAASLHGSTFGGIPGIPSALGSTGTVPIPSSSCATYAPGIALSPNEDLTCTQPNGSPFAGRCVITGILSNP